MLFLRRFLIIVFSFFSFPIFSMGGAASASQNIENFLGYNTSLLEAAFERAPSELKFIFQKITHPTYSQVQQNRAAFFVGEPGTEKTTTAIAFAYKLRENFDVELINCAECTSERRGGSTVQLRERIEAALELSEKGKVVILDEIQEVLDHAEDSHYDTASTGRYIAGLLNSNQLNNRLFIIATLNNLDTFPSQIKSRMRGRIVTFEQISDPARRRAAFLEKARIRTINFDTTCTEAFYANHIDTLEGYTGRDFDSLAECVVDQFLARGGNLNNIVANKDDIIAAIRRMSGDINTTSTSREGRDYEQRERHHQEQMEAQQRAMQQQQAAIQMQRAAINREQMRQAGRAVDRMVLASVEAMYGREAPEWYRNSVNSGDCTVQ